MNKKLKLFTQIIFFGSIWGILEATLGYVLHFVPLFISGTIMFPIASYVLYKGYQKTQSRFSLFYMAVVASTIKAVDLLLPQFSYFKTINPMISILLEGLVVVLIANLLISKKPVNKYLALPIASVSWRVLYTAYMGLQFAITGFVAAQISSPAAFIEFTVLAGLFSGLIASTLLYLDQFITFKTTKLDHYPLLASVLFIIGLISTYTL